MYNDIFREWAISSFGHFILFIRPNLWIGQLCVYLIIYNNTSKHIITKQNNVFDIFTRVIFVKYLYYYYYYYHHNQLNRASTRIFVHFINIITAKSYKYEQQLLYAVCNNHSRRNKINKIHMQLNHMKHTQLVTVFSLCCLMVTTVKIMLMKNVLLCCIIIFTVTIQEHTVK